MPAFTEVTSWCLILGTYVRTLAFMFFKQQNAGWTSNLLLYFSSGHYSQHANDTMILEQVLGNQDIVCEHHVYLSEVGSKAKKVRIELCVGPVLMFKVGIYSSFSLELCCKSRTNGWNVLRNIVLFSWRNGKAKKNSNIFYFFRFIWDMFRQDKKRYFPKTMFCENDIAVKSYYYCEEKQCARTSL